MPLRPEGERATKRARPQITRLHDAVRRYDVQAVKELMAGGAKLEADNFGRTALHLACSAASQGRSAVQDAVVLEMVTAMLSGADTSPPPLCLHCDGLTPLHLAARYGSSKLMSVLLSMCAALTRPLTPRDPKVFSRPSSHARSVDDEVILDVLDMRTHLTGELYDGNWGKKDEETGEIEMLDIEHMTLLHLALERLDPREDEMDDDMDDDPEPLPDAVRAEAEELIRFLVERGADINARDQNGRTPLHQAVGAGLHGMVGLLCQWGADPSVVGCKAVGMGNTLLHQATLRGDGEMIRLLLRAAPHLDVHAGGQNGLTPLCLAARANKQEAAKALLEGGADPRAACAFGKSALEIARINNRTAILKLFGEPSTSAPPS